MAEQYTFRNFSISPFIVGRIETYIKTGAPLGDFLSAVVCNDFKTACMHADDTNIQNLPAFAAYMYNKAPMGCWGSLEAYKEWMAKGGLDGVIAEHEEKKAAAYSPMADAD